MGLSSNEKETYLYKQDCKEVKQNNDFTVAFAGNPNVGKSTIFNGLTGMHQHTGNWPGKTVANASGICHYLNRSFLLIDIPGTYSLMSHSQEEEIARDYICFGKPDVTVVIVDATCLERNLNLVFQTMEITQNIIVCVNLLDEAKKKHIHIDLSALENALGVPVVGTTARDKSTLKKLLHCIYKVCIGEIKCTPHIIKYEPMIEDALLSLHSDIDALTQQNFSYISRWICLKLLDGDSKILHSIETSLSIDLHLPKIEDKLDEIKERFLKNDITQETIKDSIVASIMRKSEEVATLACSFNKKDYNLRNQKIDKILTSKKFGIPIMLLFLGIIFWITIVGANYPSTLLSNLFNSIQDKLLSLFNILHVPNFITELFIHGMYKTVAWVVAVMLPPMAIFFPMFTLLEDLGYLPRIAFNLDNYFKKACTSGKQALTMCIGVTKLEFFIISLFVLHYLTDQPGPCRLPIFIILFPASIIFNSASFLFSFSITIILSSNFSM